MSELSLEALVPEIPIPPCPDILVNFTQEIAKEDPDANTIGTLIASDVALSIGLLAAVNSPMLGLSRKYDSIEQAIEVLGVKNVANLFTQLITSKVLNPDGPKLLRFWDVSGKRSHAMYMLAQQLERVPPGIAQSFGIFCDVGIPILMSKHPDYAGTLGRCNESQTESFTRIEQTAYLTDHAMVGSFLVKSWGLPDTVSQSIRYHHNYDTTPGVYPESVQILIAMNLVAELAIQSYAGLNSNHEWLKGRDFAFSTLMLTDHYVDDLVDMVIKHFAEVQV